MTIPSTLLHYRILQPLGSGGMGDVYLAEDTKLGRRIALKVLPHGQSDDPERRQRFEREARAVAALNHPNIVTIHAVERDGDVTFLTMELVEGKTLTNIIPKGGLPIDRLLKLAIPLADAVTAAHDRGITHRDLKPANVMIGNDGRVKVLDFGLAKLEETAEASDDTRTSLKNDSLTGEGRIVGTVAYMSPEQAEGKPIDNRSDIFSLGVVLYEMATGEKPFKGDTTVSVLSSILRDAPPSVTDVNNALPRDLGRIVKRALVKDPEHRYQTAKDLRNDLESLKEELDSGSIAASSVSAIRPAVAVPASTATAPVAKTRAGMYAAVAAVAVAAITAALWFGLRGESTSGSASNTRPFDQIKLSRLTSSGEVGLAAISADARYVVHVVRDARGQSLWLRQTATTSNVQIVAPDAVRYKGLSFSTDNNFIYYVVYPLTGNISTAYSVPVLGGPARKIIDDVDSALTFAPDGKRFAFLRGYNRLGENAIIVAAADGSGERKLIVRKLPLAFTLNNVVWSPDGKTLLTMARVDGDGKQQIVAVDAETGVESPVGQKWLGVESVAWMPDGRGLVASAAEDAPDAPSLQLWHISYPKGNARRVTNDLNSYAEVGISADGKTLIAVQAETIAHLWVAPLSDVGSARQITTGTNRADGLAGLAWTHDGRIVYTSTASGNADLWSIDPAGAEPRQLTTDSAPDVGPTVTPDGKSILFQSPRPAGWAWRMDPDGTGQRLLGLPAGAVRPLVSPDMQWIYYTSSAKQQRETFRVPYAGGTPERLTAHWDALGIKDDGVFYHPTLALVGLSPDGKHGVGWYSDPEKRAWRICVFPMAGGEPTRLDIFDAAPVWLPDGTLLHFEFPQGVGNVYRQRIAGGPSVPVTSFTSEGVWTYAVSHDGKQLAMSRGRGTADVVLIRAEK